MDRTDIDARAGYYLTLWVRWEAQDDAGLGWPAQVNLLASDDRYVSLDDLADREENKAAAAADACLQDMTAEHRLAIRSHYTATVIRWQRRNAGQLLREAHVAFMARMNRRGFP